ncbi:MAG TPA: peptidyl-tRNA hydrolase Pth2 [Candidatus Nanoarchaeia archaeon]|nr:peptidyl-tRNA hydrolase Pth2 [Candidatus Nanoarchaeia archaeon]
MTEYKQCIVTRDDLKLTKGKLAVQVAHAALTASDFADKKERESWIRDGQKKVVLKVATLNDLFFIKEMARREGLSTALITDAGLTQIAPGTITVLGIGPAPVEKLDKVVGKLKLL